MQHVILCLQISLLLSSFSYSMQAQYTSIFSFGDSYTDTGNKVILYGPAAADLWINKPPFGMTFFGHPAGRLSDGRLVIDFIGESLPRRSSTYSSIIRYLSRSTPAMPRLTDRSINSLPVRRTVYVHSPGTGATSPSALAGEGPELQARRELRRGWRHGAEDEHYEPSALPAAGRRRRCRASSEQHLPR